MHIRFQQRCAKCRKNMVPMTSTRQFPICAPCQLKEIDQPIASKAMERFFKIPHEFYVESSFLRSIKSQYLRFGSLTPNQRDAFKKVVAEMKDPAMKAKKDQERAAKSKPIISQKERLLDALDAALASDTKAKRRKLLEMTADLTLEGITASEVQFAMNQLTQKSRGRAKLLMMTTEELKGVRDGLAAS